MFSSLTVELWGALSVPTSDLFASAINTTSMPDLNNPDRQFIILDRIDNPVFTLANTVEFLAGKFLTTDWAGIVFQFLNSGQDLFKMGFRDLSQILPNRFFKKDLKYGHLFSAF